MRLFCALGLALGLAITTNPSHAAVSEQEAKRLEGDLTPMGAERAGNQAGTIPAWDGGLSAPPPGIGFQPGGHHPDPFASDKPLYTVTPANMAQYDALLTEGHKGLLEAYPDSYVMNVYPSRRSCAFPKHVYEAVRRNAVNAKMTDDGYGVTGASIGSPFPIPQSAQEVMWNHELAHRGGRVWRDSAEAAPNKNGGFTILTSIDQWIYSYGDPSLATAADSGNLVFRYMKLGITPPSNAGTVLVMHYTLNQVAEEAKIWVYKPGARRVIRLTGSGYDGPDPESEGIRTADNFAVFNGATDRYDWKLHGKQEKIIPYNTYRLASPELQYKDVLGEHHLNPEAMRYELHRVWVVEGRLKPGKQHGIAARRVMYHDEDSWIPVATALFDSTDELVRVQEGHVFPYYDQPLCAIGSDVVYNVKDGGYHIMGMRNQQKPVQFNVEMDAELFSPAGMRRVGVR